MYKTVKINDEYTLLKQREQWMEDFKYAEKFANESYELRKQQGRLNVKKQRRIKINFNVVDFVIDFLDEYLN